MTEAAHNYVSQGARLQRSGIGEGIASASLAIHRRCVGSEIIGVSRFLWLCR